MALGLAAATISLLSVVLTVQIRDGLFSERLETVLADASRGTQAAQVLFDQFDTDSVLWATSLAKAAIGSLHEQRTFADAVLLARSPNTSNIADSINYVSSGRQDSSLNTDEIRSAASQGHQVWQSIGIKEASSPSSTAGSGRTSPLPIEEAASASSTPGVMVAEPVTILENEYILVFVYDLATEASSLRLIERILTASGIAIVLILVLVSWLVAHQAARPARNAAAVAQRLAAGDFSQRMAVHGEDEFATLATAFNEMAASLQSQVEQLEGLSRLQQRFVSDVSHELRTPLATIRMAGELIHDARSTFPPALARSAELLQNQIERFEALLADLLEISRFDAKAADLVTEQANLTELVEEVLAALEPLAERKRVQVTCSPSDQAATGEFDVRRVQRITRNLAANAIEHAEGGPVEVRVAAGPTSLAVLVRDHGVGMRPDQVEHVFDRFWRADPARARTSGGTGLGLAISQEDALLHRGRLEAWGSPGEGAAFRLVIPRWPGAAVEEPPLELVPTVAIDAAPGATMDDDVAGLDPSSASQQGEVR